MRKTIATLWNLVQLEVYMLLVINVSMIFFVINVNFDYKTFEAER